MNRGLLVLLLLISLSARGADVQTLALDPRAGEPINGFPTWPERVIHQWMNRARVDPQTDLKGCGATCGETACYTPKPPLYWDHALNRAARFHADEMIQQAFFAHDSTCKIVNGIDALYPAGCNGAASCACTGGVTGCKNGCTPWNERVGLFNARATGEIIAGASDPHQAFYAWLWEASLSPSCVFTNLNGHRYLILESLGSVGVGVRGNRSVGNFGGGSGAAHPIPSGSHYPQQAASVEAWANWYDAKAPRSASVVVSGKCFPMKLSRGTGTNGAWSATITGVGTGCHRYHFSFVDANGAEVTYPATGTLAIGESCPDWSSARVKGSCASTEAPQSSRRRAVRR